MHSGGKELGGMILENETELVYTYEQIARLYRLSERMEKDSAPDDDLRADEIEGVRAMIRKMERQVVAYYESHPERLKIPQRVA